jgi:hypothetical protein
VGKALIVETQSDTDAKKLIEHKKLKDLKCETAKKKKLLLLLYGVQQDLSNEHITDCIYEQNFSEHTTKPEFMEQFKIRFRQGPKDKTTVNVIAEVGPKLRNVALAQKRLFIGFRSVDVRDYLVVVKCNKCQDLGHIAKYCKEEKTICAHCGKKDHMASECPDKAKPKVCIPCTRRGKQCSKDIKDCPTHKFLLERQIQKTDNGQ